MTLSMPPTMILTLSPLPPLDAEVRESRQALKDRAVTAARAAAVTRVTVRMRDSSDLGFDAGRGGTPAQEAAFEQGEQPFGEQRDHRDDDHSGVDAGGVERALRMVDEQAEALVGAAVLADD